MICTLKSGTAPSSSERIADQLLAQLSGAGFEGEKVRCVDLALLPGVEADMGPGDEVPEAVASTTENAARNAVHLANVLRQSPYPPYE